MRIRPASLSDSSNLYDWRNDPHTRAMSRSNGFIDRARHDAWLARVLAGSSSLILIAETGTTDVGMTRFDLVNESTWEVSINLNPAERGRRQGMSMLSQSIVYLLERHPLALLVAEIRLDNIASRKTFEQCGFRMVRCEIEIAWFEMTQRHNGGRS